MAANRKPLYRYISPTTWPTWVGLGLLRIICWLPHSAALAVGRGLGAFAHLIGGKRRAIVRRNIELCFPDLSAAERDSLARRHFAALGISVIEMGLGRWASDERLTAITTVEGVEHVLNAINKGQGVILLSAHFTTLELSGRVLKLNIPPFDAVYRKNRSPFLTEVLRTGRERSAAQTIEKRDIKSMVRSLREGRIVWYAPDQSYSRKGAEVIPFFGVPSMHTTATSTLARLGRAVTVPYFPERRADGHYHLRILPPLDDFPGDDPVADTNKYVRVLEEQVRRCPEQYFWIHRKFKDLPDSYPDYYADLDALK
ncbi:MAG: LpxL/LpxP family Kdo(2)-lipid IV(A) lauroyl/palmitoleoyl acyltransferase [Gammaproteobacteria bacterium]|nr:LpxL/LpxP family Kdo(2)-lipid IV(A) lauroyl/palmitoleoyl acyltransferase [Gammaproteobacteria bacterium]MDH3429259.1 LpxL/LpxP family Kdo(2)-lipid IV(A) lauroyl/palmitoleoyl acyltransferase [Gammaproteobacteria bacterium]MDH3434695.1 LpxL/LpxP family Kdo(2)-lipid IV(A) lauroyl/palmitoleoyl acyltransferase [Gammaproteobacteria bacterium]